MSVMDEFADLLRRKGLRNTGQRRAVMGALKVAPHATAPDLERALGIVKGGSGVSSSSGLSRQGLYNVLEDLTRAELVRRIEPAGSPARYELRVGDNHHHAVCRSCGHVEDIDCAVGDAPCLEPVEERGFLIDEAEVTWWGLCSACRAGLGAQGDAGRTAAAR
jgi:Fur family transcriptional regulator, stress-responsive regulator